MDDSQPQYPVADGQTAISTAALPSFEALWSDAEPAVRAFLRAVTPDPSISDDLLQNTALTAFQKFGQYDTARPFKAWLVGIARFEVMRSKRAYARNKVFYDSEVFEQVCVAFEQKLEEYDDRADALRHCMEKLEEEQRALLQMRYEKNMSFKAMADAMHRAEGALRTHVCRLRSDLKTCIQKTIKRQGHQFERPA